MSDKPSFWRPDIAATFEDRDVATSYRHRPTYPPQVFDTLLGLIVDTPRAILDLGAGTGFLARPLAPLVDRVDAVDVSAAMIEEGKHLPGGDAPGLRWIVGRAEQVPLDPPYALVTAGDSLHWMDWAVVLPRLADLLSPRGVLAILSVGGQPAPEDGALRDGIVALIRKYSTLTEWRPDFDLVAELQRQNLFREEGRTETDRMLVRQSTDEFVESFHARASLSWERMTRPAAAAFDTELRQLLRDRVGDVVELGVTATIVWGKPLRP